MHVKNSYNTNSIQLYSNKLVHLVKERKDYMLIWVKTKFLEFHKERNTKASKEKHLCSMRFLVQLVEEAWSFEILGNLSLPNIVEFINYLEEAMQYDKVVSNWESDFNFNSIYKCLSSSM